MDLTNTNEFKNVVETINNYNKFLVISDSDEDGTSAAAQMSIILEKLSKEYKIVFRLNRRFDQNLLENNIRSYSPEVVIYLDSPYHDTLLIDVARKFDDIVFLYIDHHKRTVPKKLPKNLIYFDIRAILNLNDDEVISVAGIVYRLGKHILGEEFKKYSIVGLMGAIGDWMVIQDRELLDDVYKEYGGLFSYGKFPSLNLMLLYYFIRFLDPLDRYNTLKYLVVDPINSIKDIKISNIVDNTKKFFNNLKKLSPIYEGEKLVIFRLDGTTSEVSTFISSFIKKVVVIISKKANNKIEEFFPFFKHYKISIRNNTFSDIDVGKIMENYSKKIHGGGHQSAAGGLINKGDLEDFINYLIQAIENK